MVLNSKLSKTDYPLANPEDWLIGDWQLLDNVFAGRLANLAKSCNTKIKITEGYRTPERQKELYRQYKAGILKSCAIPNTSWHEIRLAIDTSTQPIRGMNNTQLSKYGLCKPLSKEGWHMQPIETINMGIRCNKNLEPVNISAQLQKKYNLSDGTISYIDNYDYAEALIIKLLSGNKILSQKTIEYLSKYQYWEQLRSKLGL